MRGHDDVKHYDEAETLKPRARRSSETENRHKKIATQRSYYIDKNVCMA